MRARANCVSSIWSLLVAGAILFTPNGMNRVGTATAVPPTDLVKRLAGQFRPFFGTRVAAKCIDRKGRATVVDPDQKCATGSSRSDVFVAPDESVTDGLPAAEVAKRAASADAGQQCSTLEALVQTIEAEARRSWPQERQDELLALQEKAREERRRLAC